MRDRLMALTLIASAPLAGCGSDQASYEAGRTTVREGKDHATRILKDPKNKERVETVKRVGVKGAEAGLTGWDRFTNYVEGALDEWNKEDEPNPQP